MICFSGLRRTLYRPGSRFRSCAAWSNRSIMASKGFSSARNVSLSGRMIAGGAGGLIAGSLMSLAHQWGLRDVQPDRKSVVEGKEGERGWGRIGEVKKIGGVEM